MIGNFEAITELEYFDVMWGYHNSSPFALFTHMSYSSDCILRRPSTFMCVCLPVAPTSRFQGQSPQVLAQRMRLTSVHSWRGPTSFGCRLLGHPSSHTSTALPSQSPPQTRPCSQEVTARSHRLLILQYVLSPSSAAGAMERWEGGCGLGGGSMAAWPLAQGSISLDFGFPKPDCTWDLWW